LKIKVLKKVASPMHFLFYIFLATSSLLILSLKRNGTTPKNFVCFKGSPVVVIFFLSAALES
jgi:hypothetical protein